MNVAFFDQIGLLGRPTRVKLTHDEGSSFPKLPTQRGFRPKDHSLDLPIPHRPGFSKQENQNRPTADDPNEAKCLCSHPTCSFRSLKP